jgi:hypothetical protein
MNRHLFLPQLLLLTSLLMTQVGALFAKKQKPNKPIIQLSLAGGYAALSGIITEISQRPYGFADHGGFATISARHKIHKALGLALEITGQAHTYDAEKAAHTILDQDRSATAARVEATGYRILTAAIGPYYELRVLPALHINIAALAGSTTVFTPQITESIKKAPHTETLYKKGRGHSFYVGGSIRPTWYLTPTLGIGLLLSAGYSNPQIQAGQTFSLKHMNFRSGLELSIRL